MSYKLWTHTGTIDFNERDLSAIMQLRDVLSKSKLRPFQWKLQTQVPNADHQYTYAWLVEVGCRDDSNNLKYLLAWVYWTDRADIKIDEYQISTKDYDAETGKVSWVPADHKLKGVK